jgi:hypothetical protein
LPHQGCFASLTRAGNQNDWRIRQGFCNTRLHKTRIESEGIHVRSNRESRKLSPINPEWNAVNSG